MGGFQVHMHFHYQKKNVGTQQISAPTKESLKRFHNIQKSQFLKMSLIGFVLHALNIYSKWIMK